MEVTAVDEEDQPEAFEFVDDEGIAQEVYEDFRQVTQALYDFE